MRGRITIVAILLVALIAGAALYYLQVYAYYREVNAEEVGGVQLTSLETGELRPVMFENFKAIDSDSSPLRFRACFSAQVDAVDLAGIQPYADAEPLVAPGWFDCFDAGALGEALKSGQAQAYLGVENVTYGIDRVVALYPDGRGYVWHQINHCGEIVFDGNPAPEGCPPVPERLR